MNFTILITAPVFDSQGAYSAYQFAKNVFAKSHSIEQIFFYNAGVYNANRFIAPPSDELNLVQLWQMLAKQYSIKLHLCVAAAQRRGVIEKNLADGFSITGLGQLIEAINASDRFIVFN